MKDYLLRIWKKQSLIKKEKTLTNLPPIQLHRDKNKNFFKKKVKMGLPNFSLGH